MSDVDLGNYLESLPGIGTLNVVQTGDCANYAYTIGWNDGGNKPQISVHISSNMRNIIYIKL